MRRVQNFTPETYAAKAQSAGQKRKHSRQLSCQSCKRTKTGCDRKRPSCGNCLRKGIIGECSYEDLDGDDDHVDTNRFTRAHPPNVSDQHSKTPVLVTMEGGLGKMERTRQNLGSNVNSTRSPEASSLSATPPRPQWSAITAPKAQQKHEKQINPHSGGVLCSKTSGPLYYIGKTGWTVVQDDDKRILFNGRTTFAEQWNASLEVSKEFKGWQIRRMLHCASTTQAPTDIDAEMLRLIPDRGACDILILRFLNTFNATHPIVDPPVFQAEVEEFWQTRTVKSTIWLGLFTAIISLGYQLPVIPLSDGAPAGGRLRGGRLMSLVKSLVFTSPAFSRRPDLRCFQLLLVLILSQSLELDWVDGNDAKHGLLALASRMAFTLGLHRDPRIVQDPRMIRSMSDSAAPLRRMLWSTFKFVDLEHCIQSGMPFLLRESDSDVKEPDGKGHLWPEYQSWLARAMPVWAQVVQLSHSAKATLRGAELWVLQRHMDDIVFPAHEVYDVTDEPIDTAAKPKAAIQRAVLECSHHRMMMVLYDPFMTDADLTRRKSARQIVLNSARAVLAHQTLINAIIENDTQPHASVAWAHLAYTLLHCNFYHAIQHILLLIRLSRNDEVGNIPPYQRLQFDYATLFDILHTSLTLAERSLAFSPCNIKGHMIFHAIVRGVEERLRLCVELRVDAIDMSSPEADSVIRAMQLALQQSLDKGRTAINKALESDDPPAALCGDSENDAFVDNVVVAGEAASNNKGNDFGVGAGVQTETEWTMNPEVFPDLVADVPFWLTAPLWPGVEWDPESWVDAISGNDS